jgi:hypothetical protein
VNAQVMPEAHRTLQPKFVSEKFSRLRIPVDLVNDFARRYALLGFPRPVHPGPVRDYQEFRGFAALIVSKTCLVVSDG